MPASSHWPPALSGTRAFILAVVLYFLAQAVILSLVRTGTSYDGAEQLLYSQYFSLGYGRSQPPLYTWLLIGVQEVLGVSRWAENILKFGLLALCLVAARAALLAARFTRGTATAAALSLFLVPEIVWEAQRNYSHTVLLLAAMPLFLLVYFRIRRADRTADYLLLGYATAVLLLSKYNSGLFIAAVLAADTLVHGRAALVLRPRFWLAMAVAALLFGPHLLWMTQNWAAVTALSGKFKIGASGNPFLDRAEGLGDYLFAVVAVAGLPTIVLASAARRLPAWRARNDAAAVPALASLLLFLAGLALVLGSGATQASARWALPFIFLWLPVLASALDRAGSERPGRRAAMLSWAAALVAMPVLIYHAILDDPRVQYEYGRLLDEMASTVETDTVLTTEYPYFANLRFYRPELRVLNEAMPGSARLLGRHPVAVWREKDRFAREIEDYVTGLGLHLCMAESRSATLHARLKFPDIPVRYAPVASGPCPGQASPNPG